MAKYYDGDLLLKLKDESPHWDLDLYDLECYLEFVPTADVVEVKHGKWVFPSDFPNGGSFVTRRCSKCGYKPVPVGCVDDGYYGYNPYTNYCPNCGAKMDGVE